MHGLRSPYPREATMHGLFGEWARRTPDAVAVRAAGAVVTYAELDRSSASLAAELQRSGTSGGFVGVYAGRGVEAVVGMLGVLRSGAGYLPLDPADPPARVELMLTQAGARTVVTTRALAERLPPRVAGLVTVDPHLFAGEGVGLAPEPEPDTAGPLSPAYVMYTSGSTGVPKAVCVPHRAIVRLVIGADYADLGPDETLLHLAPLTFDAATFEIWGALLNGATVAIMPPGTPGVRDIAGAIEAGGVTVAWLPTVLFHEIVRADPGLLTGLRRVVTGGDVLSADAVRAAFAAAPDLTVVNCYGPTEATTFSCAHVMTARTPIGVTVPIGRPIANTTAYVLDERLEPVGPDVSGELCIGGDGVALGYLDEPALTARAFRPDPFSAEPGATLYRTGDRVLVNDDGTIEFRGRIDRQVKIRGFRVELGEVETLLARHPLVQQAVAVPRVLPSGDRQIVAYVTPSEAEPGDGEPGGAHERIELWRRIYDGLIYDDLGHDDLSHDGTGEATPRDPQFNISGWTSSYTGRPIPEREMREQVDQTVERVQRSRPRRVLEIGCGTGLLMFRLRPSCERYVGTDFSDVALEYARQQLAAAPAGCRTTLVRAEARDLSAVGGERFDAVVLNSIVQHFPSGDHLRQLLAAVADVVVDGGVVFLGDLRSRTLLQLFHLSVLRHRCDPATPLRTIRRLVAERVAAERELALDPGFFASARLPRLGSVRTELKRGHGRNEMTGFRYDATLSVGAAAPGPGPGVRVRWGAEVGDLRDLEDILRDVPPGGIELRSVPNRRTELDRRLWSLAQEAGDLTLGRAVTGIAGDLPGTAVDPEQLWALGARHGLEVRVDWDDDGGLGDCVAAFTPPARSAVPVRGPEGGRRRDTAPPQAGRQRPWRDHCNDPMAATRRVRLAAGLRDHLRAIAPAHLVPAFIVVLDAFPVGAHGKIDLAALPEPRPEPLPAPRGSPRDTTTTTLAGIWERILGLDSVDERASLFDLGGNSLTVIQLVSAIEEELGARLSPVAVFQRPTVAGLAELLACGNGDPTWEAAAAEARRRGQRRRARSASRRPDVP